MLKIGMICAMAGLIFTPMSVSADAPLSSTIAQPTSATTPVVVDCVGDSITAGVGASSGATNYVSLLGDLLGPGYVVHNFGESGSTLLKNGDSPYWQRRSFAASAGAAPNVVVIMLGTNDSKPQNWKFKDQFGSDYAAFIDYFSQLPTHPQIFVCTPTPVPGHGIAGINEPAVLEEIPIIQQTAEQKGVSIIDVQAEVPNDPHYFVDTVHPNDSGYVYLAGAIYSGLTHAPVIEPIATRTFTTSVTVSIQAFDTGSTIHYTVDGSDPSRRSPIYNGPITVTSLTTIKAQEFHGKKKAGLISSATFTPTT